MDEHVVHELTFLLLILLVAGRTRSLINERVNKVEDKQNLRRLSFFGIGIESQRPLAQLAMETNICSLLPLRLLSLES